LLLVLLLPLLPLLSWLLPFALIGPALSFHLVTCCNRTFR
jgi:hypothetical protein